MVPRQGEHIHFENQSREATFTHNGQRFHWTPKLEVVDETGSVFAELESSKDPKELRVARVRVKSEAVSHRLMDYIALTALIVQVRHDEAKTWF